MAEYTEAKYLVKVAVTKIWINCPRYIHKYQKLEQNKYVPRPGRETPLAAWKRLDLAGDVISDEDKARVAREASWRSRSTRRWSPAARPDDLLPAAPRNGAAGRHSICREFNLRRTS